MFFFFLLSLFLLLINNLHLDYFYRNHDEHDNKWPPSSQCKQGTGQGLRHVMIHLEPEVFIYYTNDYLKAAKPMNGNNMYSRGGN